MLTKLGLKISPRRTWYLRKQQIRTEKGKGKSFHQAVISRSQCFFRCFDASETPTALRDQVLALKLQQWSPWQQFQHWIVWRQQYAMIWLWEKNENLDQESYVIPETLLENIDKHHTMISVRQLQEGYELQCWYQGVLQQSLWQEKPFTSKTIRQSIFSSPFPAMIKNEAISFTPQKTALRPYPWAKNALTRINLKSRLPTWIAFITVTAFITMSTLLITQTLKWKEQQASYSAHYETLMSEISPIQMQKREYMQAQQNFKAVTELLPKQDSQGEIMLAILNALTKASCQPCSLQQWWFENNTIEMRVAAQHVETTQLVESLNASKKFSKIRPQFDAQKQQLYITMQFIQNK